MTRMLNLMVAVAIAGLCLILRAPAQTDRGPLVVHEWGTFTALQDESGRAMPGINVDDEPLPEFVHRLGNGLLEPGSSLAPVYQKGVRHSHPDIVMRLETPVIYFYPPPDDALPITADLEVEFRGGWLTEFYPSADCEGTGIVRRKNGAVNFGALSPASTGSLRWRGLRIGAKSKFPSTDSHVWLTPRSVTSAPITSRDGECEQYIFYRGVAAIDSPVRIVRSDRSLEISSNLPIHHLWLVDVHRDGSLAFKTLPAISGSPIVTSDTFEPTRETDGHDALFAAMRTALTSQGLYEQEADAMLNTWEVAYFRSPGLRLFYTVPQVWTNSVLPLIVSLPSRIVRVMIGRIEIVSPDQRMLLERISRGPTSKHDWFYKAIEKRTDSRTIMNDVFAGRTPLARLGIPIPADYQAYIDLGRFRNALILDEYQHRPTQPLREFIENYRIHYSQP